MQKRTINTLILGITCVCVFTGFAQMSQVRGAEVQNTALLADTTQVEDVDSSFSSDTIEEKAYLERLETTEDNTSNGYSYIKNKLNTGVLNYDSYKLVVEDFVSLPLSLSGGDEEDQIVEEEVIEINLSFNPFAKTNLTVKQFNTILEGTSLQGLGESYYKLEETHNINGVYAISVAFNESGYGKYKANTNNYYGMRNGSNGWMTFETPDANIQYFGKLMNGSYYAGKSLEGIAKTYCPPTYEHWLSSVKYIMQESFNKVQ